MVIDKWRKGRNSLEQMTGIVCTAFKMAFIKTCHSARILERGFGRNLKFEQSEH